MKMTKNKVRGFGASLLKVVATVVAIWLIAFSITVFDGDGSVGESQADIFDFSFGLKSNQVRFTEALESMGHPEPQVFDLNGNIVHFSVNYHHQQPLEVMRMYQEEFVTEQLNDELHLSMDPRFGQDRLLTRLTGGIAPIEVSPDRIVMGGMLTRNIALETEDLHGELFQEDHLDLFRGHRHIEIYREPDAHTTTVLANWSDENFSYEKMLDSDERNRGAGTFDADVPACPGCSRVNHFADLKDERGYRSNIYVTSMSQDQMVDFYRHAMVQRGWEESEFQQIHEKVQEAIAFDGSAMKKLRFTRGEKHLQIFAFPLQQREIAIQTVLWQQLE